MNSINVWAEIFIKLIAQAEGDGFRFDIQDGDFVIIDEINENDRRIIW